MNSKQKIKCTKDQESNSEKCITQKQETKITIKGTQGIDNILGKTWLWQNLKGLKKEKTQTYDRHN